MRKDWCPGLNRGGEDKRLDRNDFGGSLSEARTRPIIARDGTTFWVVGGGLVPGDDFNLGQGSTAIDVLERGGDSFELLCGDTALALADGRFLASSLQDERSLLSRWIG